MITYGIDIGAGKLVISIGMFLPTISYIAMGKG
jgi:hypothetical protein